MVKINSREIGITTALTYLVVTMANIFLSSIFPNFPILKTGTALILLMVSIVLVMAFTFASDNRITKEEITMFFAILIVMVVAYFVVKSTIPQLFSMIPEPTKEVFEAILS